LAHLENEPMTTKKATEKPKGSATKSMMSKAINASGSAGRVPVEDLKSSQAMQFYEQALRAMQAQKFEKAKPFFEKIVSSGPRELADRARLHLNICNQQLSRAQTSFRNVEEHFDFAVSLMNMGDFVTAREHLESMSTDNPELDFVWYGLAALECLTGHTSESLRHLAEAIRLNPQVRFQARNDSDFKNMADDPRFTELVYPEGASV
jgi:tetratricopeptide (TPR) repeat protein